MKKNDLIKNSKNIDYIMRDDLMDYLDLIYEIFLEEEIINECLDKDLEMFLDSNPKISFENIKIQAYKTSDELDKVYYIKNQGYKTAKITKHTNFASIIFLKTKNSSTGGNRIPNNLDR